MFDWIKKLTELQQKSMPAVIVHVTKCIGSTPCRVTSKMIVLENGTIFGTIGGGKLEYNAIEDAQRCLKSGNSIAHSYPLGAKFGQCCGGKVEVFMEPVNQEPNLYIFGAGHIGEALARMLVSTVFKVHLIDSRNHWFERLNLPESIQTYSDEPEFYSELVQWNSERCYIVILTHQHDLDQEIVEFSIKQPTRYMGLIGSQTKWERFQKRILAKSDSHERLLHVHCPVGLPIGAESPQEIAISIAAELLKEHYSV